MKQKKIILREDEMPTQWYNICPDIPNGLQPPLDPGTKECRKTSCESWKMY